MATRGNHDPQQVLPRMRMCNNSFTWSWLSRKTKTKAVTVNQLELEANPCIKLASSAGKRVWASRGFRMRSFGMIRIRITWIMVYKRNHWIHCGQGFSYSFDAPWSERSWITDPGPDHPKGTNPYGVFFWEDPDLRSKITRIMLYQRNGILVRVCKCVELIKKNNNNNNNKKTN